MRAILRARKIGKSHVSLTGAIRSLKDGLEKRFESPLERDLLTILDFDSNVESFYDQPVTISYFDSKGVGRNYTPDVLIHFQKDRWPARSKGTLLAEVKTKRDLAERGGDYAARFLAAGQFAEEKGWQFRVLTEDVIRTPYLTNARFLREYQKRAMDMATYDLILSGVRSLGETTVGRLLDHCCGVLKADQGWSVGSAGEDTGLRSTILAALWRMVADRMVLADFHKLLDISSPIAARTQQGDRAVGGVPCIHSGHFSPLWL